MGQDRVDGICARRTHRTAGDVARAEHEVIDEELGATVEKLGQGTGAVVGVEAVLLVDRDPRKLAALSRELVAHSGVLLLPLQELVASRLPFLAGADPVIRHWRLLVHCSWDGDRRRNYRGRPTHAAHREYPQAPAA